MPDNGWLTTWSGARLQVVQRKSPCGKKDTVMRMIFHQMQSCGDISVILFYISQSVEQLAILSCLCSVSSGATSGVCVTSWAKLDDTNHSLHGTNFS